MKKRLYIAIAALLMCGFTQMAEAKSRNAHAEAHKQQLAAAKNIGLDKTTITRMVEEDIAARESVKAISAETDELLNDLLTEARSHIGKKYVWASKGPNTFDCSGFSSYVYRQFGYSLSPCSRTQFTQGEKVDKKDLRKGDLVFFQGRSGTGGVGHVGIVVDVDDNGNFSFIHASIKKGVTITSGSEAYYAKRFLGGKRVIE
ncbi:MAG: C40 family peptidase [Muribaculaceae bacterium]|nr:C40 family peptidase [Muribaculaceae bacterium]MDE6554206.1 C40 family peptidase [Muribaculaceae bacterium]